MACVDVAKRKMGLISLIRDHKIAFFDPDGRPFLRVSNWTREQPQSATGESVILLYLYSHAKFIAQLDFIIELTDEYCLFNQIINRSRD